VQPALQDEALATLQTCLNQEQRWVKVHAAELLVGLECPQGVQETFTRELEAYGDEPQYRIGIWRVLSKAARQSGQADPWYPRIVAAYEDAEGPDRTHAAETLGKHGRTVPASALPVARGLIGSPDPLLAATSAWLVMLNLPDEGEPILADLIATDSADSRRMASYALRWQPRVSDATAIHLAAAARREPLDSPARVYLCSAAYVHAREPADLREFERAVLDYVKTGSESQRHEATSALALRGGPEHLAILETLLRSREPDSRVGAAHAIVRIARRTAGTAAGPGGLRPR
jgi:hypothetical protein